MTLPIFSIAAFRDEGKDWLFLLKEANCQLGSVYHGVMRITSFILTTEKANDNYSNVLFWKPKKKKKKLSKVVIKIGK